VPRPTRRNDRRTASSSSSPRLKFAPDTGFHAELKRRVDAHFEHTGRSRKGGWPALVKAAVLLLALIGSYLFLLFVATTWWHAGLAALALALAAAGIGFAVQHDANHGALSKHASINRAMGWLLDLLGASSYVWKWKHNVAHHTYTNVDGADSDIDIPFTRLSPAQPYKAHHRFQRIYVWPLFGVFILFWHLYEDFQQLSVARIANIPFPRPRGREAVELVIGKLLFVGWAFVLPMQLHAWWLVLLFYVGICAVLGLLLAEVFEMAHVVQETDFPEPTEGSARMPLSWAVHQVQTTADFAQGSRFLTWYLGGLNFQIEHHLFPRISHRHYPDLAPIVREVCAEYDVRYDAADSLGAAFLSHWRWIGQMSRSPAVDSQVQAPNHSSLTLAG